MRGRALQERRCWRMCRCSRRGPTRTPQGTGQWPLHPATWTQGTMSWVLAPRKQVCCHINRRPHCRVSSTFRLCDGLDGVNVPEKNRVVALFTKAVLSCR